MAIPTTRHDPHRPDEAATRRGLLGLAVGLLLGHVSGSRDRAAGWRFGPLVIISPADGSAAEAVLGMAAARGTHLGGGDMATWDGDSLGREIAAALAEDRLDRLAATLSATRLVIVDRIDRVAGDERQEALAHLLDTATAAGTVWCVSVPRLPIDGPGPRCATRLGAGLVVPAPPPGAPARTGGAVPSLGRVFRVAARHHDVPVEAVLGPERRRTVAAARSLAMYLARRLTGRSLQAIGAACGGRDHTTVLHGVRVCGARIASDPAFAADVDRLATELAGTAGRHARAGRRRSDVGSAALERTLARRRRGQRRQA